MLKRIHENFIKRADAGIAKRLPVTPTKVDPPLVAVERWRDVNGMLVKRYRFRRIDDRIRFIEGILEYEGEVQHHATIMIEGDSVGLRIKTHGVDVVTELDREYAKFADVLYKDVVYSQAEG